MPSLTVGLQLPAASVPVFLEPKSPDHPKNQNIFPENKPESPRLQFFYSILWPNCRIVWYGSIVILK
jgi:hypothetical protein